MTYPADVATRLKSEHARGQLIGAAGVLLVIGVALGAWFLVGGKVLFTRPGDGNGSRPSITVFP